MIVNMSLFPHLTLSLSLSLSPPLSLSLSHSSSTLCLLPLLPSPYSTLLLPSSAIGDRYAAEPRSRSKYSSKQSSSHYDEDARGPIGAYHDDENGYKDEVGDYHRAATQEE